MVWPTASGARRPLLHLLGETTVVLVLLTLGYYLVPLRLENGSITALRWVGAGAAFGALAVVFRWQVRHSRRVLTEDFFRIMWLLSALYLLVLGFAMAYAVLAAHRPDQLVGVTDRTAALYFAMTIVSTVGLGDVHPGGQTGQVIAIVQMVFDVIYLGTALRMLTLAPDRPTPSEPSPDGEQAADDDR